MNKTIHKLYRAERKDPKHPTRALSALRTARALFLAERLEYEGHVRFDIVPDDCYDREDWIPDPNNPELKERDIRDRYAIGVVAKGIGSLPELDEEDPYLDSLYGLTDNEEEYGLKTVKEEVGCQVLSEWIPRYPRLAPLLLGYDNLETLKKDLGL